MGGNRFHRRGTGHRERTTVFSTCGSRFAVIGSVVDGAAFSLTSNSDHRGDVVKTDNRCGTLDIYCTLTYVGIDHVVLDGYRFNRQTAQFL